ncbi:MAG: hypothetical protein ACE5E1_04070 [Phycisphaerae bacterium]
MHQRRNICKVCTAAALFAGLLGTGCQLGPAALKIGHARYSDAVQRTAAEQLLLNLVRLRYREAPVFLEVGSISSSISLAASPAR